MRSLLRWYVRRIPYITLLTRGGKRAGLDGSPAGDVSEEHQADAHQAVQAFGLVGKWIRADWPDVQPSMKAGE
jgi:sRNA-binding protein